MSYVDGFVLAVPKKNVEAYKKLATTAREAWMEHGALAYVEALADDVPYGEVTSFPRSVQASKEETVIFAWITYRSREERDAINKKVMQDPRMQSEDWRDVFDGKRMIYGGFVPFLE
jgi:uncharacterized protein YbaA (DUF1428 family)